MTRIALPRSCVDQHLDAYFDGVFCALDNLSKGKPAMISGRRFSVPKKGRKPFQEYFKMLLGFNSDRSRSMLVADPSVLRKVIVCEQKLRKKVRSAGVWPACKKALVAIFSYEKFCDGKGWRVTSAGKVMGNSSVDWGAAQYIKSLGVKYCPYCNADTVYSVEVKKRGKTGKRGRPVIRRGIARSALDHYYPRGEYPFLGICLCNLVPACTRCNTSIKGDFKFPIGGYANPFEDDISSLVRFEYVFHTDENGYRLPGEDGIELSIKADKGCRGGKARKLVEFFQVPIVYNALFRQEVLDALDRKRKLVSQYGRSWLRSKLSGLSRTEFNRLVYGYSLDPTRINSERLGKLMLDVLQK